MTFIPPIARVSGLTAAMIFMVIGWPLANALSATRVLFVSFQMKLVLAALIGAVSAPLAETHAPALQQVVNRMQPYGEMALDYWNNLSDPLR